MLMLTTVSRSTSGLVYQGLVVDPMLVTIVRVVVAVLGDATIARSGPTDSPATLLSS